MHSKSIDVDTKTFVRFWLVILGFGLLGLFIWKARVGLLIVCLAVFLALAIRPLARRIENLTKRDKNSSFAPVTAYAIIILILAIILAVVAPVVVDETARFLRQFPDTFEQTLGGWDGINNFGRTIGIDNLQDEILTSVQTFSNDILKNLSNLLMNGIGMISQGITATVLVLVLTLLLSIEGPNIMEGFWSTIEGKRKNSTIRAYRHLVSRIANVISTYVSHQLMVAILDGCVVLIAVFLLSLICGFSGNLAIPLGLIAMIFYLIPMFGQIISCVLISLLLLFSSPVAAITFFIFYIIYAQIENNFIAPKIQGDAQGLPSAIVLIAIIIGMYMFGLIGAIVAIPIAGIIKVIFEELPNLRER